MSSKKVVAELDVLLSSYHVFYMNLRGYHWNLVGNTFFELHPKFEEYYNITANVIDDIAERIRTLGHFVSTDFSNYTAKSVVSLKASAKEIDGETALKEVSEGYAKLIEFKRGILPVVREEKDFASSHLLLKLIKREEKSLWMINAYLNKK